MRTRTVLFLVLGVLVLAGGLAWGGSTQWGAVWIGDTAPTGAQVVPGMLHTNPTGPRLYVVTGSGAETEVSLTTHGHAGVYDPVGTASGAVSAHEGTVNHAAFVGDAGAGGTKGMVPAPAAGDAAAGKYLKADGTWATVTATPGAHAASHQNGGGDEVATATAGANAIPKAGAGGTLAIGWIPTGTSSTTVCIGDDARLSDARTPASHAHGNITNDGKIGSTASLPLITTTAGAVTVGAFGTGATDFCAGNDGRLSDARTPLSHAHAGSDVTSGTIDGDRLPAISTTKRGAVPATGTPSGLFLKDDGTWASASGAPAAHASTHNAGGSDALAIDAAAGTGSLRTLGTASTAACAGNDSRLSDARTPTAHSQAETTITFTDVTTGNMSASAHGYAPKGSGSASDYLNGNGLWSSTSSFLTSGGALGTPSSGTLTNCGSLPVSGITSSTSTALGVGTLELGHASDTTLARSSAGVVTIEGNTVYTSANVPGFGKGFMATPGIASANITSATSMALGATSAYYLGRAFKTNPTFDVRCNVTTGYASGVTWAEVGIATGTPAAGGNPSLTTRGYTSVVGSFNSTGRKTVTITTSGVNPGDDVWILLASGASGTAYQIRAYSLADDLQSGVHAVATSTRPSTMGAGTSFTLAGATVLVGWVIVRQY